MSLPKFDRKMTASQLTWFYKIQLLQLEGVGIGTKNDINTN